MKKIKKNGFTLVEIIIAMALSGFVMIGSSYLINSTFQVQKNEDQMFWLEQRRSEMIMAIQNDQNWSQLASLNPQMDCANRAPGCMAFSTPQKLILKLNADTILDGTNSALGLNKKGDFCYQFNATTGHTDCVVGVGLTWQALCLDTSCVKPQFKIDIIFQHKDSGKSTLKNLHHFNLSLYSDAAFQNLYDVCASMGGTLVGTRCQIPALNTVCDPSNLSGTGATFALGFSNTGSVICGQPAVGNCSGNQFLTGFNTDGSSICTAGCGPVTPPVAPVDCVGAFGACSATACGTSGVKTYAITRAAVGTGNACPYSSGATQSCSAPPCYSNCTGAPCFVAGTPVLMADGHYKAIEKMQAGDEVVSYDEHQQTQRIDKVLYPTAHQAQWQRLHHFQLVDGTKFTSNAIHPFYVVEKDYWFEAHEISSMLKQGQRISLLNINNKPILIKKISIEHKKVRVYNIEVHGISSYDEKYGKWGRGHSYYVKGVLTHNKYAVQACIAVAPGDPYEVACSGCASGWINTGGACIKCPTGKVYTSGMCCVPGGTVFDP